MTTTVRISEKTRSRVAALAGRRGVPMSTVIDEAVEKYEDALFWDEVRKGFDRMSPEDMADYLAEQKLYEGTVADGLADDEDWSSLR